MEARFQPSRLPGHWKHRLQDVLAPVYKAKAQLLLWIFLLLRFGEEENRREGLERRTTKGIKIIVTI